MSFQRSRRSRPKWQRLFIQTFLKWQQDECLEMGAALSYYALFSIFPIVLVILSIFGWLLGPSRTVYNQILGFAYESLPGDAFDVVENVLVHLNQRSVSAGIVGFLLAIIVASGVFGSLDRALNRIWNVQRITHYGEGWKAASMNFMMNRAVSIILVLSTAVLMFISLVLNVSSGIILRILRDVNNTVHLIRINEVVLIENLQVWGTFLALSLMMMILFKVIPATRITWKDVWPGAILTAATLMLLQYLVSNSVIQIGKNFLSYGVVGGVMVLMFWIYLICQIVFLGSEFTYTYTNLYGSRRHHP